MPQEFVSDFPPIEAAYDEEFGRVDPEIYEVGRNLWTTCANRLAEKLLHDSPKGMQLMLKAVAKVSSVHRNQPSEIKNIRSYLYRSYKNLILIELEKENSRQELIHSRIHQSEVPRESEEDTLNQKILVNELRRKMDSWMREVFELRVLGYDYEELAPKYGSAGNVIRSKFSKKLAQLAQEINADIEEIDRKVK
jgi:DNA-directed RNA polymerase specialized sigma24 family protein